MPGRPPTASCWCSGDNRNNSLRLPPVGTRPDPFLPQDAVIGQAEIIYWPPSHLGFLD